MPCFSPLDATGAIIVMRPRFRLRTFLSELGATARVVAGFGFGALAMCGACGLLGAAALWPPLKRLASDLGAIAFATVVLAEAAVLVGFASLMTP